MHHILPHGPHAFFDEHVEFTRSGMEGKSEIDFTLSIYIPHTGSSKSLAMFLHTTANMGRIMGKDREKAILFFIWTHNGEGEKHTMARKARYS